MVKNLPYNFMKKKVLLVFTFVSIIYSCNFTSNMKNGNNLIHETSPYLLQHAQNPVNWSPWKNKYLEKAISENKLIVVSIGYASCHWCHVMERESFQDSLVAKLMNDKFISIKVDREERPDIDQIYMNAIQLMTGSGGWPLNVITLPNGKPIWGGTYFSKEQWLAALNQISDLYEKEPKKFIEYADRVQQGLNSFNFIEPNEKDLDSISLVNYSNKLLSQMDYKLGGLKGSPKFMMPNNLNFLLRYSVQENNKIAEEVVLKTLKNMAYGGIFDHVDGGFSRYSTDEKWHIPHFEKMLYDNGQLMSIYSKGYKHKKEELFKNVVYKIHDFIKLELKNEAGGFYSSLDADSKVEKNLYVEGEYYTWDINELKGIILENFDLFSEYYNINEYGYWENENKYVLIKNMSDKRFMKLHNLSKLSFEEMKSNWINNLKKARKNKIKPSLDYKIITSWNGIMISGYVEAYKAFNDSLFKNEAIQAGEFIYSKLRKKDGGLFHNYVNGKSKINGYLEDYASIIQASLDIYEITLEQIWIERALELTEYVLEKFSDSKSPLLYFTSSDDDDLISRSLEFRDNVIPSSNSIMAKNLFKLYHYFDRKEFYDKSKDMALAVSFEFDDYPSGYSNWFDVLYNFKSNFYEVAVLGNEAVEKSNLINLKYLPNKLIVGSNTKNDLPLLKNRFVEGKTLIYVCVNKTCKLPTENTSESINMIKF